MLQFTTVMSILNKINIKRPDGGLPDCYLSISNLVYYSLQHHLTDGTAYTAGLEQHTQQFGNPIT